MSINSSASASVNSNSANKGLSSMMSGMDTETMVEQMLAAAQNRIDKADGEVQQTEWKQEMYREIIDVINNFHSKYFDTSYGSTLETNFANKDFFNQMNSIISGGNALNIIGTSPDALEGDFDIVVKELASNTELKSSERMSKTTIEGEAIKTKDLFEDFDKTIKFQVGTEKVTVNLNGATTEQEIVDAINTKLSENANISGVTVKSHEGSLRFITDNTATKVTVDTINSSKLGLSMTGLGTTSSSTATGEDQTTGNIVQGGKINMEAGIAFDITLDGVTKTINLTNVADATDKITVTSMNDALKKEVKNAFGDYVTVDLTGDTNTVNLKFAINIKYETGDPDIGNVELGSPELGDSKPGHELNVTGGNISDIFGIKAGTSTNVNTQTKLSDLKDIEGDRFKFDINGTKFTFDGSDSIGDVIRTVNNSDAGVNISYSNLSDSFKITSSESGEKYKIAMSQQEGNLLGAMFGAKSVTNSDGFIAADKVSSDRLTTNSVSGNVGIDKGLPDDYKTKGGSFEMVVNGENYKFTLPEKEDDFGNAEDFLPSEIAKLLNADLARKFGKTGDLANIQFDGNTGKLDVKNGAIVEFNATKVDLEDGDAVKSAMQTDLAFAMGFNKTANSNVATKDTLIKDIVEFSGKTGEIITTDGGVGDGTLGSILSVGDQVVSHDEGRLVISFKDANPDLPVPVPPIDPPTVTFTPTGAVLQDIFGTKPISLSDGTENVKNIANGNDAVVVINGTQTTRSNNHFTIDGITMELTQVSKLKDGKLPEDAVLGDYEKTVISTDRDVDVIVETFSNFVDDYNKMIEVLNGFTGEKTTYRDYPPLTDAQRKEMSESEIKSWEEKAKEGLLYKDSYISTFTSDIRSILYTKPEGNNFALYDIGIETGDYKEKGKLHFDEEKLLKALLDDPESVQNLFTDSVDGLAKKMMASMDNIANDSAGRPGSLVALAGHEDTGNETTNMMFKTIFDLNIKIKDLERKYELEKKRYWEQFNNMETILSGMNAQSQMFSQQFSGY